MKHFIFTLSMPNNNSWNGRWTGDGDYYALGRSFSDKETIEKLTKQTSHYYNFGDGWGARISIAEVSAVEKRKALSKSKGFYGYDWMVDEICSLGRIRTEKERHASVETKAPK
jgi:hypothetical protein